MFLLSDTDYYEICGIMIASTEDDAKKMVRKLNSECYVDGFPKNYRYKEIICNELMYVGIDHEDVFKLPSYIADVLHVKVDTLMCLSEIIDKLYAIREDGQLNRQVLCFLNIPHYMETINRRDFGVYVENIFNKC